MAQWLRVLVALAEDLGSAPAPSSPNLGSRLYGYVRKDGPPGPRDSRSNSGKSYCHPAKKGPSEHSEKSKSHVFQARVQTNISKGLILYGEKKTPKTLTLTRC